MSQNTAKMVGGVPFSKETLQGFNEDMQDYQVRVIVKAIRIEGSFLVETQSGDIISCHDGYLAVDAEGYPYPINAETTEIHRLGEGKCCDLFCDDEAIVRITHGPTDSDYTESCGRHIYDLMTDAAEHVLSFI